MLISKGNASCHVPSSQGVVNYELVKFPEPTKCRHGREMGKTVRCNKHGFKDCDHTPKLPCPDHRIKRPPIIC